MIDYTVAGYSAALFDVAGWARIEGFEPVIIITPNGSKEICDFLMDVWGGTVGDEGYVLSGQWTWSLRGFEDVRYFIEHTHEYTLQNRVMMDILLSWEAYNLAVPRNKAAAAAANFQLARNHIVANPQPMTFDIETMGLDPEEKNLLSCSFQWGDEEGGIYSIDIQSSGSEKQALIDIRDYIETAPWLIGFNSIRFDLPYINRRLAKYDERPVFIGLHVDVSPLYDALRGRSKRTSLIKCVEEMGLADDDAYKTPIDWDKWNAANAGDKAGMAYVLEHSVYDVILTKRLYNVTI